MKGRHDFEDAAQSEHASPRLPQALLELPGWQPMSLQHPLQFPDTRQEIRPPEPPPTGMPPPVPAEPPPVPALPPAVGLMQLPDMQNWPPAQVVHMLPPEPHFIADGVCTHMVPSQQPPQFAGPQVVAVTQAPLKQLWPAPHC